jgi:hypothetical protein
MRILIIILLLTLSSGYLISCASDARRNYDDLVPLLVNLGTEDVPVFVSMTKGELKGLHDHMRERDYEMYLKIFKPEEYIRKKLCNSLFAFEALWNVYPIKHGDIKYLSRSLWASEEKGYYYSLYEPYDAFHYKWVGNPPSFHGDDYQWPLIIHTPDKYQWNSKK